MINQYLHKHDETVLPAIMDAIMVRRLSGLHEETDDEIMNELQMAPIDDVDDMDFENDFEETHETDNEIDDLYNARDHVMKKMVKDQYFNMDDKKWADIVEDGVKHGFMTETKECEAILEDMLSWDKLLPGTCYYAFASHSQHTIVHRFMLCFICYFVICIYVKIWFWLVLLIVEAK